MTVRVGTSGWQYDDWRPAFYPEGMGTGRWLGHYVRQFPTVEVNATFYRLPTQRSVQRWHDTAPDRFRYAVKGSRYITHNLKLGDGTAEAVDRVVDAAAGLRTFLGIWLWQLPPNLHRDVGRLRDFVTVLPAGHQHAVEFRHASWFHDEVHGVLDEHGVAPVWLSDPELPAVCPVLSGPVYVRFHGSQGQRYHHRYSRDELVPWADRIRDAAEQERDVWVFFNNDVDAAAVDDARTMSELLPGVTIDW
ncbi:DUF72 domain-containing protein [Salsipaludibacter albus]|uniref:DUF72 domain-containing protein n=1 Tax=Salsipaludibacter albus TaxID=2849650 RepID=UPI001EE49D7D|nr:DUF72 domain-containing protein [Salsipaludibacter albus]MBY5163207.1 DUF72 domain-containing protein [Salsipaludibacter albus]